MAWWFGVAFWAHEGEGTAAVFEDRVEEDAETAGEFDVVAGVAEPCCAQGGGCCAGGEEVWFDYRDGWRGCVREFPFACYSAPEFEISYPALFPYVFCFPPVVEGL